MIRNHTKPKRITFWKIPKRGLCNNDVSSSRGPRIADVTLLIEEERAKRTKGKGVRGSKLSVVEDRGGGKRAK